MSYLVLPSFEILSVSQITLLFIVLTAAVFYDLKSRRVPNQLMAAGALTLLILQIAEQNFRLDSWLIGLVVSLTLWQLRFIGGGDSKLLMLVSAVFAPVYLLTLYLCISLAGGLQAALALAFGYSKKLPYAVAIAGGTTAFILTAFAISSLSRDPLI